MGARCGSIEPASCQVSCAGDESRGCATCCSSASTSSPIPVAAISRAGSKEERSESKEVEDSQLKPFVIEQEPVVKAKRSSRGSDESPGAGKEDQNQAAEQEQARKTSKDLKSPKSSESDVSPSSGLSKKEKKVATLRSAIAKVKGAALGTVNELKTFRKFLKPRFGTPGEAFDDFIGFATQLDKRAFMARLEEQQYVGNSERLFQTLSGDGEIIQREVFKQRLVAIGRVQSPKKKEISFGNVVIQAVKQMKKADIKQMNSEDLEDSWDPPPAVILEVDDPLLERGPWKDPSSPFFPTPSEEVDAASGQPSASGQPPRRRSSSTGSTASQESAADAADCGVSPTSPTSPTSPASPTSPTAKARAKGRGSSSRSGKPPLNTEASRRSAKKDTGAGVRSFIEPILEPAQAKRPDDLGVDDESLEYSTSLLGEDGLKSPQEDILASLSKAAA